MRNAASILSSLRLASGGNQDRGTWAGRLETTIVGAIWRAGGPSQPWFAYQRFFTFAGRDMQSLDLAGTLA